MTKRDVTCRYSSLVYCRRLATKEAFFFCPNASVRVVRGGALSTGAEALSRCAKMIDEKDGDAAAHLFLRACEMLEDEDKHVYTADHFRAAGAVRMRQEKWAEAAEVMMRFGAACDVSGSKQSQCKAYLSAVVALLYGKESPRRAAAHDQ